VASDFSEIDQTRSQIRPPIRRGDLPLALAENQFRTILIIDGEFYQKLAVSPKEILLALRQNLTIIGAASMGAMRAAELAPYGMVGVGEVYKWYKSGFVYRDDDVALLYSHMGAKYKAYSVPMVNIIWLLRLAKTEGWLSSESARRIHRTARQLHWRSRNWTEILNRGELTPSESHALSTHAVDPNFDVKRLDALASIRFLNSNLRD
jgi:TfuA protein